MPGPTHGRREERPLELFIDPDARGNLARSLYDQIRDAIVTGRLTAGERLEPSREVARTLGVSRHTVTTVYGRLAAEGFIEGRAGGGSYVSDVAVAPPRPVPRPAVLRPVPALAERDAWWHSGGDPVAPRFDLRPGSLDPALFPRAAWRRCMLAGIDAEPGAYASPAGTDALRRAIARWIGRSRGVDTDADQVIVTAGAQQAIHLVIRLLAGPGDAVAVEDPGYPPVRSVCRITGATVQPVPVDGEGIVVDQIPASARVVYTTPSHQLPTGVTMSLDRRRQLLDVAEARDLAVIEDDYDSEYRHVDRPLEPLHRLDRSGRVAYVGTFAKTLSPSLRLGFAVLPPTLVDAAINLRRVLDWQPAAVLQVALLRFIDDGLLDAHLRRTRRAYRERHGIVAEYAERAVRDGWLSAATAGAAGLHVAMWLPDGADEDAIRRAAARDGVAVGAMRDYWQRPDAPPGLVVGFGGTPTDRLDEALGLLATTLRT